MKFSDFHMHSTLSDGQDDTESMIRWAIKHGMPRIGFSEHSYAPYYAECSLSEEGQKNYISYINELRDKYRGQIDIYCGIEQEFCYETSAEGFDYVIGSVHYIETNGSYAVVDRSAGDILSAADTYYGGDLLGFVEDYYRNVSRVCEVTNCDIIGHFDLVTKFNEKNRLFDCQSDRYKAAWHAAAESLLDYGKIFEINTGAISRGCTSVPYPAPEIVSYLAERGAKFVLSGDSHRKENICFGFDYWFDAYSKLGAQIVDFIPQK